VTNDAFKDELIESISELVSYSETFGFSQTREILLVAMTVLSQETRLPNKPVQGVGGGKPGDHRDRDRDWYAKEEIYLQALTEAQDEPGSYTCSDAAELNSAALKLKVVSKE